MHHIIKKNDNVQVIKKREVINEHWKGFWDQTEFIKYNKVLINCRTVRENHPKVNFLQLHF